MNSASVNSFFKFSLLYNTVPSKQCRKWFYKVRHLFKENNSYLLLKWGPQRDTTRTLQAQRVFSCMFSARGVDCAGVHSCMRYSLSLHNERFRCMSVCKVGTDSAVFRLGRFWTRNLETRFTICQAILTSVCASCAFKFAYAYFLEFLHSAKYFSLYFSDLSYNSLPFCIDQLLGQETHAWCEEASGFII